MSNFDAFGWKITRFLYWVVACSKMWRMVKCFSFISSLQPSLVKPSFERLPHQLCKKMKRRHTYCHLEEFCQKKHMWTFNYANCCIYIAQTIVALSDFLGVKFRLKQKKRKKRILSHQYSHLFWKNSQNVERKCGKCLATNWTLVLVWWHFY